MMYSLNKFWPVKTGDLIRAGRKWDGGYVINKRVIRKTKNLISLGISYDWSFEKDFKSLNRQTKIFAFDLPMEKIFDPPAPPPPILLKINNQTATKIMIGNNQLSKSPK